MDGDETGEAGGRDRAVGEKGGSGRGRKEG